MFWLRKKKISFCYALLTKVLHVQDINSKHPDETLQKLNPGISSYSALLAETNHSSEQVGNYNMWPFNRVFIKKWPEAKITGQNIFWPPQMF